MQTGAQLVEQVYRTFIRDRDIDAVLRFFTPDAQWHPVTPSPLRGESIPIRLYWEDNRAFLDGQGRDWRPLEQHVHEHGPFVLSYLRSNKGEGLMVYRLEDGKISDIWAIDAEGRSATGVF